MTPSLKWYEIRIVDHSCTLQIMSIDDNMKKIAMKYAIDKDEIRISPCQDDVDSKNYITLYKYVVPYFPTCPVLRPVCPIFRPNPGRKMGRRS